VLGSCARLCIVGTQLKETGIGLGFADADPHAFPWKGAQGERTCTGELSKRCTFSAKGKPHEVALGVGNSPPQLPEAGHDTGPLLNEFLYPFHNLGVILEGNNCGFFGDLGHGERCCGNP